MSRLLRLAGWIEIVVVTLLALGALAGLVLAPMTTFPGTRGGPSLPLTPMERLVPALLVLAAWLPAAALGALMIGFADLMNDVRALREATAKRASPLPFRRHGFEPVGMSLLGSPTGVLVDWVAPDELAASTGLRQGDLILAVNGTRLTSFATHEERVNAISYSRPAVLDVLRDEERTAIRLR